MRGGIALVPALVPALLVLALHCPMAGAQESQREPTGQEIAARHLAEAERLWNEGIYEQCREEVKAGIGSAVPGPLAAAALTRTLARLHTLEALLEYTFRDEGYTGRIDTALGAALELDPYFELGDPSEVPAFVITRYARLRDAYLARFARSARPNAVGAFAAMVLEPTVFTNPSVLQPGFSYSRNIGDKASVEADFRFPLQWPPWNSIRGQLGVVLFPAFSIERVATGISISYVFGLDQLTTYTHSLSLGGRAEWLGRSGFGFAANAELARVDLVIGGSNVTELPRYTEIPLLGLVNMVFANVTLYAFYVF